MWLGDVSQSNDMVKHSAGILLYGSSSGMGNSKFSGTGGVFVPLWSLWTVDGGSFKSEI